MVKRIYMRSVRYIFFKALKETLPEKKAIIKHSISKGIYIEISGEKEINANEVDMIKQKMDEIISRKIPFVKMEVPLEYAKEVFLETGREDKFNVIEHRKKNYVTLYDLDGVRDYFYGYMVPDTSYIDKYEVRGYKYGVIIIFPDRNNPKILPNFIEQVNLFNIFREHEICGHILDCRSLGDLNKCSRGVKFDELVEKSEYLHDMKIKEIASIIRDSKKKIVFLAGPSSSGKTSTARRIANKLKELSVRTITISMDDYYKNQIDTPIDINGEHDLEHIEALDLKCFKEQTRMLCENQMIEKPIYDFTTGTRSKSVERMKLEKADVAIIEGIHGLNPIVSDNILPKDLFRIYVSALTSMNIDDHNRIPTTDTRLLRRLVRDKQFRNSCVSDTLKRWPSVRRGEEKYIFPYQDYSDYMFNSTLFYELAVLKSYADEMLKEVDNSNPEYSEARRLRSFLSYIYPAKSKMIPSDSIIKEFIGGSSLFE